MSYEISLTSPALKKQSTAYPERYNGKVPLQVKMKISVYPDLPFLAKADTEAVYNVEYYAWVNSHGAVSAICENGEQLGLKPNEFEVTKWH